MRTSNERKVGGWRPEGSGYLRSAALPQGSLLALLGLPFLLVLLLGLAACGEGAQPERAEPDPPGQPPAADTAPTDAAVLDTLRDAAAARACADCEEALERCYAEAQDGAMLNACLGAFARCHVAATGLAVACPDEDRCGSCLHETDDPEELVRISECILVVENVPEAARCRNPLDRLESALPHGAR